MTDTPEDLYPQPPEGYQPAVLLKYPTLRLNVAAVILFVLATPPLLVLTVFLQYQLRWEPIKSVYDAPELLIILVTVLATTTAHELVHGGVCRLLGYRVSFGMNIFLVEAFTAVFGQWQTRNHNILVALGPLVVLTALFLPALCVPNEDILLAGLLGSLMNIGGSVGDIYLAYKLLRMPRRTLLYDVDAKTMLVYAPVE
jgi:hypothetical protein